jgi:hypothetical protein
MPLSARAIRVKQDIPPITQRHQQNAAPADADSGVNEEERGKPGKQSSELESMMLKPHHRLQ